MVVVEVWGMRLVRVVWLVVVVAVFCVPLFQYLDRHDAENDEGLYSYAVDSILQTGDWLNPRISPKPEIVFVEKPPLKFWLVAAPMRFGLLPHTDFGMRFFDAVMASAVFLYVFAIGRRMAGPVCGVCAALVLFTQEAVLLDHGVRGNNMEAAVMLAYAGGLYHFLRWTETVSARPAARHAVAVGLYGVLGFMTKTVAVAFLPVIMVAVAVASDGTRAKCRREWTTWAMVAAGAFGLVTPWFVYQTLQRGGDVWQIMFGIHIVQRFQSWLDPAHVHPWHFYFTTLASTLRRAGSDWLVVCGAVLIGLRLMRRGWNDGAVVVWWFVIPFVAMSFSSSKLWHYAYPFLAPVALAGGYATGWLATVLVRALRGRDGEPASDAAAAFVDRAREWSVPRLAWAGAVFARPLSVVRSSAIGRAGCSLVTTLALGLAVQALVLPGRVTVGDAKLFSNSSVLKPAVVALASASLAGRAAWAVQAGAGLVAASLAPVDAYPPVRDELAKQEHPMRDAAACLQAVRARERAAGRPLHDLIVVLPETHYQHWYFYYFQAFGWNERRELADDEMLAMLENPGAARPVLMLASQFDAFVFRTDSRRATAVPRVRLDDAVLFTPGPYAACAR
jgi:hypothetical protein